MVKRHYFMHVKSGNKELIKYLVNHEADINKKK